MEDKELLIFDALLRISVLETLLIEKGIFTKEEASKMLEGLTENITNKIKDKLK